MPFQSDKQRKFLFKNKPSVAKQLAKHSGKKRSTKTTTTRTKRRK